MLAHFARRLRQRQAEGGGDGEGPEGMVLGEGGETIMIDGECTVSVLMFEGRRTNWLMQFLGNVRLLWSFTRNIWHLAAYLQSRISAWGGMIYLRLTFL